MRVFIIFTMKSSANYNLIKFFVHNDFHKVFVLSNPKSQKEFLL